MAHESSSGLGSSQDGEFSVFIPADTFHRVRGHEDHQTHSCDDSEIREKFSRFVFHTDEALDYENTALWPTILNDTARGAVSRFLDRNTSSHYWNSDLKIPSGRFSTDLRCLMASIKPGTYNVCWHFAYIISRHEWTNKATPADLICFAGEAVNEKTFIDGTTNPSEPSINQDWNDVIKPQNRVSCSQKISTDGVNFARGISENDKEVGRYLALMSRESLIISEGQNIAFIVRKLGYGQGTGELFFLGCEIFPAVNAHTAKSSLPPVPSLNDINAQYEWSYQVARTEDPAVKPNFAKLCKTCKAIFRGRIVGKVSSSLGYSKLIKEGKKYRTSLNQTTEELMLAARRDCQFCFLRWRNLKSSQETRGNALYSPIFYYLIGSSLIDRLCMHHIPNNGTTYMVTEFALTQAGQYHQVSPSELSLTNDRHATWEIIRFWSWRCNTKHELCKKTVPRSIRRLPTRLIDLGPPGSSIRPVLCYSDGMDVNTSYVTLSHCWGGISFHQLTQNNHDELKIHINIALLSRTFKDAMETTRNLGLRYIWIDSLCIVQDSKEDWNKEAALMGSVYEHSYCNIAASKASNGNEGCFTNRNVFDVQQFNVLAEWEEQKPTHYYIRDNFQWNQLEREPLFQRGWVVQESMLAKRILHFSKDQVLWECPDVRLSETCPFVTNQPLNRRRNLDPSAYLVKSRLLTWEHPETADLVDYAIWRDVVDKYSSCQLTFPEKDKLLAVSGIARLLCHGDEYLAGLWRKCLPAQLMWQSKEFEPTRPKYCAPSWSWASVEGAVMMRGTIANEISAFRVVHAEVTPSTDDKFGPVSAGYLRAIGPLAKSFYQNVYDPNSPIQVWRLNRNATLIGRSLCAVYRDVFVLEAPIYLLPFIMPPGEQDPKVEIPPHPNKLEVYVGNPFFSRDTPCGLVLGRCMEKKGLYKRLGYFRILSQDDAQNMRYFYELFTSERENLHEQDYEERLAPVEPGGLPNFQICII